MSLAEDLAAAGAHHASRQSQAGATPLARRWRRDAPDGWERPEARQLRHPDRCVAPRSAGAAAAGSKTSTATVNLRCSPGGIAPTPTIWRVTSSPRSFVIVTITAYSQDRKSVV